MARQDLPRRTFLQGSALALAAALSPWPEQAAQARPPGPVLPDETGADLWLRYRLADDDRRLSAYRLALAGVVRQGTGAMLENAEAELRRAITAITGVAPTTPDPNASGTVVIGTRADSTVVRDAFHPSVFEGLGDEGFAITSKTHGSRVLQIVVGATGARGVLYGVFHLIRLLQTGAPLERLDVVQKPSTPIRIVNHWDNLNRSVERGYAGQSIFDWSALPELDERITDYCRAMSSIGINASVINNVNANTGFITSDMITRLSTLGRLFADWGISMWLSVNYASPMAMTQGTADEIDTADPFDQRVQDWWRTKVAEITRAIPTLGGFLVKANSEGQPGPLDYGRTHAEGANMLARVLAPHGGKVIWRSFVHEDFSDWAEYQYRYFAPLDGEFDDNVIVQTKYGPIDFQVREPVHPLFGELSRTNQMVELQITQEYTGHEVHAVYLAPMWREVLDFTTKGPRTGPTIAEIVTGKAGNRTNVGISGVINFGDDPDWTGYQLGQANTYAFGRLAWDVAADPEDIAAEWVTMTFSADKSIVKPLTDLLMASYRAYENYTSPLGMGYLTDPGGAHLDPSPVGTLTQSHHTTDGGTGFDRTVATGSGYTGLYPAAWSRVYEDLRTVPDELLLFMHWVPYGHVLHSGKTVIQHIYDTHFTGLETVSAFKKAWGRLTPYVDAARHADITASFQGHEAHARLWRDTIVSFFFEQSRIVDRRRTWLQVKLPSPTLVLGGWPNVIPAEITNASRDRLSVSAGVQAPGEWETEPVKRVLAAAETATFELAVSPPLAGAITTLPFTIDPSREILGSCLVATLVAPAGQRCHLALDGGTATSAVLPGWTRLAPQSTWQDGADFGWVNGSPGAEDRSGDPLSGDFIADTRSRTLRIRVPAGRHTAQLLVGDKSDVASAMTVSINGSVVGSSQRQLPGSFTWIDFPIDGGPDGGTVDLVLASATGRWRVNALAIPDPDSPLPPAIVTGAVASPVWWTSRSNAIAVTVVNTSDADQTVQAEVGLPDGWTMSPGETTIPAGETGEVLVHVTPPADPLITSVLVTTRHDGQVIDSGRTINVITTLHPEDALLALDAGPDAGKVLAGYHRLAPSDTYSPSRGYGWEGPKPLSRDRANSDDLRRDLVMGKDVPFTLRVDIPAGTHTVWILTGDSSTDSGVTTISENGRVLAASGTTSLPSRAMLWFSFQLDGGVSGRTATLEITGSLLNGLWRVGALVIPA